VASEIHKVSLNSPGDTNPASFTVASGILYFVATTTADGREVWSYDGTTLNDPTNSNNYELSFDIAPGDASSDPEDLITAGGTVIGGRLFFTANDGTSGREVWVI